MTKKRIELTQDLINTYEKVKSGEISVKKGIALAYMANTILKSVITDIKFSTNKTIIENE